MNARRWVLPIGLWLGVSSLSPALAAAPAAPAPPDERCDPGSGPSVDVADLAARLEAGEPLVLPRNATLLGPLDRNAICPDAPAGTACFLAAAAVMPCVRFTAPVDLRQVVVTGAFDLRGARLDAGLRLEDVQILGPLDLSEAEIAGEAVFERLLVNGDAILDGASFEGRARGTDLRVIGKLALAGTNAPRGIELRGSLVVGELDLSPDSASSLVLAESAIGGDIAVHGVAVEEELTISGVTVNGEIEILDLEIAGPFKLERVTSRGLTLSGRFAKGIELATCRAKSDVDVFDATIEGTVSLDDCRIEGELFFSDSQLARGLRVENSRMTEGIDLGDAKFGGEVVLIGSRFGGPVDASLARLDAVPRVVSCDPPDPIVRGDDEFQEDGASDDK